MTNLKSRTGPVCNAKISWRARELIAAGAFVPRLTYRQVITKLDEASRYPGGLRLGLSVAAITPPRWLRLRLPARPLSQPGCRR